MCGNCHSRVQFWGAEEISQAEAPLSQRRYSGSSEVLVVGDAEPGELQLGPQQRYELPSVSRIVGSQYEGCSLGA